jgi:flagellar motor switch protein FliG
MDITSIAPIIHRLRATLKEELENIREVKNQIVKTGAFELAASVRDLEKKVLEMQRIIDPMG